MIRVFLVIISMIFLLTGCGNSEPEVDVKDIIVSLPIDRMEMDTKFQGKSGPEVRLMNDSLLAKYGEVYEVFVQVFLRYGSAHDPMVGDHISLGAKTGELKLYNDVQQDIETQFADFSSYQLAIQEAMKYYKYYYPDSATPTRIITMNSYFNAQSFVSITNDLCIGLDMFVGPDNPNLKLLPKEVFPEYLKQKMDEKYLVSIAVQAWLLERCHRETGDEFLDRMVSAGKIMYLMHKLLPKESDEILFQYSSEDLAWCIDNQENVWNQLVDDKSLYSKDPTLVDNWIKDGPFTKGLPQDSPSRIGRWIGYQMVVDYMTSNPEVTIQELVEEKNPKRILKHYEPEN